jgi:putative transposase
VKAAIKTLNSIVIRRPTKNKKKKQQNLCLDKGYYSTAEIEREVVKRRYIPHIRKRGEKNKKKHSRENKRRGRWVVERTNSWHNRFRKLLIRYEKKSEENYLGLVQFACCMIIYRGILLGWALS